MYRSGGQRTPAWVPRLNARYERRRGFLVAGLLFGLSAGGSYLLLSATAGSAAPGGAVQLARVAAAPAELALPESSATELVLPEPAPIAVVEDRIEDAASLDVITGRIPETGTVSRTLAAHGVTPAMVNQIAAGMLPVFNFRAAHPGDFFALIRDSDGKLLSFEFQRGRRDVYRLERGPDGRLLASQSKVPLERRVVQVAGIVERSLFDAVIGLGEGPDLVNEFAEIFIWDVDFSRQTRPGDEFRLIYEKYYDRDGFVYYGNILAAQYSSGERELTAVYYVGEDGQGDYYTPDGSSLRRTFLRAPLRYSRISSRYTNSRLHPILHIRRPHRGIDYAAPTGTPIWAVADGEVIFKGWSGGFGRLIKIRHNNGYVSYYGHLSRYAKGLRKGSRVTQRDVIAYVGSSGLASGPHLDYRLQVDGRFIDPMKLRFDQGDPVPSHALEHFAQVKQERMAELHAASPALVLEAAM